MTLVVSESLERRLKSLAGVTKVMVNRVQRVATVDFDPETGTTPEVFFDF